MTDGSRGPRSGFTMLELLIVILAIGIMLAFAYKRYGGVMRRQQALDAASRLVAVGLANRRYALDHQGKYVHRRRLRGSLFNCDEAQCLPCDGPVCPSCNLLACKYVGKTVVTDKNYYFNAVSPDSGRLACGLAQPEQGSPVVACASQGIVVQKPNRKGEMRFKIEYGGWAYTYHADGTLRPHGGAPEPKNLNGGAGARTKDYDLKDSERL